jgi:hypothetical protein
MSRFWPVLLAGSLIAPCAWAAGAGDKAAAEALFAEGRKLLAAGDYAAACGKFEASQRLDPGVGTMLNLADCYEKTGKTASAWAEFRHAAAMARAAGSRERVDTAGSRAAALEGRLSRLTIRSAAVDAQIAQDGRPVDPATFGVPLPVDPGRYTIEASAPGKEKWSRTVDIKGNRENVTVDIPPLGDGPRAPAAAPTSAAPPAAPPAAPGPEPKRAEIEPARAGNAQRAVAIGAGAIGVAGLAVGTYFGLRAASLWTDAKSHCQSYPDRCSADATSVSKDAVGAGNLSTAFLVIGGLGVVGGAVLWFTAPRTLTASTIVVGVSPSAMVVRGAF